MYRAREEGDLGQLLAMDRSAMLLLLLLLLLFFEMFLTVKLTGMYLTPALLDLLLGSLPYMHTMHVCCLTD